ncbi:MAG: hypothetical protein KGD63_06270 [Candidatus Lokiarchaeota archaeon]|nr:hypothetical protein [Candidatus Lokiarchaeota archaeon]
MIEQKSTKDEKLEEKARLLKNAIRNFRRLFGEKSLQILIFGEGFPKKDECWKGNHFDCNNCENSQCKYAKIRILLRDIIVEQEDSVIFPEELQLINPTLDEELFLQICKDEYDLIIMLPVSFGSVDEFSSYSRIDDLATKMRVFVEYQFHPFYTTEKARLIDSYLKFLTVYGHVYPYRDEEELVKIVKLLTNSYRKVKILESLDL